MEHAIARKFRALRQPDWDAHMRERIGAEVFNGVGEALETAIRARIGEFGLDGARDEVVRTIDLKLNASCQGQNVVQGKLDSVLGEMSESADKSAVEACGKFMLALQRQTPISQDHGRRWIRFSSEKAARRVSQRIAIEHAQGLN